MTRNEAVWLLVMLVAVKLGTSDSLYLVESLVIMMAATGLLLVAATIAWMVATLRALVPYLIERLMQLVELGLDWSVERATVQIVRLIERWFGVKLDPDIIKIALYLVWIVSGLVFAILSFAYFLVHFFG